MWWAVRGSPLAAASDAQALRQAYRVQSAQDIPRERDISQVVAVFRSADVEPVLLKGWAIARQYAQPALRPSGDIDLLIDPERRAHAERVLDTPEGRRYYLDLDHDEFARLNRSAWDALYSRTQLVTLGLTDVRVLGPEDHLAFLCRHFFRHGGCRPLWLCDIAAALEARAAHFDWDGCLGRDRKQAEQIACALALAGTLLGADLSGK